MWLRRKFSSLMSTQVNYWQEGVPSLHRWNSPNTTEFWSGMDTEENFKNNPHPGYSKTSITYTYNKFGFRTHEFEFDNTEKNILCLGCSHTEGIGVQTPWPVVLQEKLFDYKVYNLGHGGGSFDTIARLITNYVPLLKPKKVFILWPSHNRYEVYGNHFITHVGSWKLWGKEKELLSLLVDEHTLNWAEKNKIYVKLFSKIYNFEMYEQLAEPHIKDPVDRARDNAHFGPITHSNVAKQFLKI